MKNSNFNYQLKRVTFKQSSSYDSKNLPFEVVKPLSNIRITPAKRLGTTNSQEKLRLNSSQVIQKDNKLETSNILEVLFI
jgi:hypothetical protein